MPDEPRPIDYDRYLDALATLQKLDRRERRQIRRWIRRHGRAEAYRRFALRLKLRIDYKVAGHRDGQPTVTVISTY